MGLRIGSYFGVYSRGLATWADSAFTDWRADRDLRIESDTEAGMNMFTAGSGTNWFVVSDCLDD